MRALPSLAILRQTWQQQYERQPAPPTQAASPRMVKKSVRPHKRPHNKIFQEAPEEQCQFLLASVLRGMPTRSDPLAPHHDGHEVIQLQGYHGGTATGRAPENEGPILTPLQVAGPALATRIAQPHASSVEWSTRRYLGGVCSYCPCGTLARGWLPHQSHRVPWA